MPPPLSHADAIAVARRGRKLLRAGRITHRQLALLDCLLWCCREPATGRIVVSYSALQRLCHVSRDTVAGAVRALERLGVLRRIRRWCRVAWHQGGLQSRRAASRYELSPGNSTGDHHESGRQTVIQGDRTKVLRVEPPSWAVEAAQRALAERRRVIEARLLANKAAG